MFSVTTFLGMTCYTLLSSEQLNSFLFFYKRAVVLPTACPPKMLFSWFNLVNTYLASFGELEIGALTTKNSFML